MQEVVKGVRQEVGEGGVVWGMITCRSSAHDLRAGVVAYVFSAELCFDYKHQDQASGRCL